MHPVFQRLFIDLDIPITRLRIQERNNLDETEIQHGDKSVLASRHHHMHLAVDVSRQAMPNYFGETLHVKSGLSLELFRSIATLSVSYASIARQQSVSFR